MTTTDALPPGTAERILVIKHGALGDLVLALGPFAAIRKHHQEAQIVLLTTPPFANFMGASGYFDAIWSDSRPKLGQWRDLIELRRRFHAGRFRRVYDLQTSGRTNLYYRFLFPAPRPEWSGIAKGCSHPHVDPGRGDLHTLERQAAQLHQAGLAEVLPPNLDWAEADVGKFALPDTYALLIPGGAAHRPEKRWPLERYVALAAALTQRGSIPVVIGGPGERALGAAIAEAIPQARDLTGNTDLLELAVLARGAQAAIGNDTGPMHLAATAGAPAVVLFGPGSDPARARPRGPAVHVVQAESLKSLEVTEVLDAAGLS